MNETEQLKDLAAYLGGLNVHVGIIIPFNLSAECQQAWKAGYNKAMESAIERIMIKLDEMRTPRAE